MTWRKSTRYRRTVVATALAVAVCGVVPAGAGFADEPVDAEPTTTEPEEPPADEPATEPDTGEVDGAVVAVGAPPVPPAPDVAVGLPPVPPVVDEPQVAVGQPPVPPAPKRPPAAPRSQAVPTAVVPVAPSALTDTVSASLDLIDDCL